MSPAPAPAPSPAPAPAPSPPAEAAPPAPAPAPSAPEPSADRFPLDEEPAGNDEAGAPSPRVVSSSQGPSDGAAAPKPTPSPTPSPAAARPSLGAAAKPNGGAGQLDFWQALVVAAVSAGKDADAAVQLADTVVEKARQNAGDAE
jgi:hypothetical protein